MWLYRVDECPRAKLQERLNELGENRWELVSATPLSDDFGRPWMLLLKKERPLTQEPVNA